MKKSITSIFLILFLCIGCKNEKLVNGSWKYQEGYRLSDWLDFEENILVRNDTIFKDSVAYAKFIKVNMGYFGVPAKLHIASLKTDEIGIYTAK